MRRPSGDQRGRCHTTKGEPAARVVYAPVERFTRTRSQMPPAHRTPAALVPSGDGSADRIPAPCVTRCRPPPPRLVFQMKRSGRNAPSPNASSRLTSTRSPSANQRGLSCPRPATAKSVLTARFGAGKESNAATSSVSRCSCRRRARTSAESGRSSVVDHTTRRDGAFGWRSTIATCAPSLERAGSPVDQVSFCTNSPSTIPAPSNCRRASKALPITSAKKTPYKSSGPAPYTPRKDSAKLRRWRALMRRQR